MRRVFRIIALALALCVSLPAMAERAELDERLDALFHRFSTLGACVAVFQNGEITYVHAYGEQRIGGAKVTPDTLFQVGSISKMVSNIGLLQLLDREGISLDAELGSVLGCAARHPEYADIPVTLRQLMTHTASLRDSGDYQDALSGNPRPLNELLTSRAEYAFLSGYMPGTKRHYSNLGGGIIGSLIEALSGQTVDAYMTQNVFEPLRVKAAYQPALLKDEPDMAALYHMPERRIAKDLRADETLVAEADAQTHYSFTAGKLIISAPDLCRVLIALCDGGVCGNARLLRESVAAEVITPQNYRGSVACATNNGLFLNIVPNDVVEGRTLYGHGGKANGMLCAAYFDPTDRTGVVMLTNGCKNNVTHNGVGSLSRMAITLCYERLISPEHVAEDPFAVR